MNSQQIHKKMRAVRPLFFISLISALCIASLPAFAVPHASSTLPSLHLPLVEESPISPSGFKTTWSCVWFGNYPSEEVVQSSWAPVNDEALSDGDVIVSDELYGQLSQAEWQDNVTELEGVSYLRVGQNSSPSLDIIREQHYNFSSDRPWHYFKISPIRWRVLDIKDGKAMLVTDRMPDSVPFHEVDEDVTWDECTLRSWLNGYGATENKQGIAYTGNGFIDRAFTEKEQKSILPTLLENLPNQDYGTGTSLNMNANEVIANRAIEHL